MFINQPSQHRYHRSNQLLQPHLPKIGKALGGEFVLVDMEEGVVSRLLDQKAGIDGFLVQDNQLKSVALRVKIIKKRPLNDFTIRSHTYHSPNTELHKTPLAITSNATYPNITLVAQIWESGDWISGAAIYTKDLYQYILQNQKKVMNRERANGDGSRFVWVGWSELQKANYKIKIF